MKRITMALAGLLFMMAPLLAAGPASKTDQFLGQAIARQHIPGLAIAVVKDGKIVLSRHYGSANLQAPAKVGPSTVFAINSITKAFTGVAAMQMVEQGKLDPEAPVSTYVDDLPESWRPITIRQLLSHMSGLADYTANGAPQGDSAALAWAKQQPLHFPPGERYEYCQTNYALVQIAINRLKGVPAETPLALSQFTAAGMTATRYGDFRDVILHRAESYGADFSANPPVLHPRYEVFSPLHRASSGINSTADDMARWMIAVMDHRLLSEKSLAAMWTKSRFANGKAGQWGLGWMIGSDPAHPSAGMTGGSRAAIKIYPKDRLGIVILTNLAGATPEDFMDEIASFYIPGFQLSGVAALRQELETKGYSQASTIAARMNGTGERPDETELNDWAYRLLSFGKPKEAVQVFELITLLYPDSANAFDSLGEAYAITRDKPRAIEAYRKSLVLDPANKNAAKRIEKLSTP